MMKNIFNIMSAASFAGVLFMILMLTYVNITKASREERNKQYIESVVEKAVLEQIVERMPSQTGKVAK
tara:strand:+ start:410 stop:613 length:204 start_codon:yes stop_codon:yes gene_type:complete